MKEFFRKRLVALKRSPQNIPFVALIIAFGYYSFNLTKISDTTAYIQGANMGLSSFATMLFSLLIFVCFLNSFPKRKKPNFIMIALMYVMFAIIIVSDFNYRARIIAASSRENFAEIIEKNKFILEAQSVVTVHVILVLIAAVLIALIPVYSKLLRKINTNIDVEYSGNMSAIDVEE